MKRYLCLLMILTLSVALSAYTISGTIHHPSEGPSPYPVMVYALGANDMNTVPDSALVNPTGQYLLQVPQGAWFVVAFPSGGGYFPTFFGDTSSIEQAAIVHTHPQHPDVTGVDIWLIPAEDPPMGVLSGHVTGAQSNGMIQPLQGICIEVIHMENPGQPVAVAVSYPDGFWMVPDLPYGQYIVHAWDPVEQWASLYWPDSPFPDEASAVSVSPDIPMVPEIDFLLQPLILEGNGTLQGFVNNVNGQVVDFAEIILHSLEYNQYFSVSTDPAGQYYLEGIPAGMYIMGVFHPDYMSWFYDGALSLDEAIPLVFAPDQTHTVDVTLVPQQVFTISGQVVSLVNGEPIAGAEVGVIWNYEEHPDFGYQLTDETSPDGGFTLTVPQGSYRLYAWANGHDVQFWNHQSTFVQSDILHVSENVDDLLFELIPAIPDENSISGSISVEGNPPQFPVLVIAISSDEDEEWEQTTTSMNPDGGYDIPHLDEGYYWVMAISASAPPTYYNDDYEWENAQLIYADGPVENVDIELNMPEDYGQNQVVGDVIDGSREPVRNAAVIFLDSLNHPVRFAMSDETGAYYVSNLPNGTYRAIATLPGYFTAERQVIVSGDRNLSFEVSSTATGVSQQPVPTPGTAPDVQCYPNPFNPILNIRYNIAETAITSVEVFNVLGQKVRTLVHEPKEAGLHHIRWNGTDDRDVPVASGVYLYRVKNGNYTSSGKILLMK